MHLFATLHSLTGSQMKWYDWNRWFDVHSLPFRFPVKANNKVVGDKNGKRDSCWNTFHNVCQKNSTHMRDAHDVHKKDFASLMHRQEVQCAANCCAQILFPSKNQHSLWISASRFFLTNAYSSLFWSCIALPWTFCRHVAHLGLDWKQPITNWSQGI